MRWPAAIATAAVSSALLATATTIAVATPAAAAESVATVSASAAALLACVFAIGSVPSKLPAIALVHCAAHRRMAFGQVRLWNRLHVFVCQV